MPVKTPSIASLFRRKPETSFSFRKGRAPAPTSPENGRHSSSKSFPDESCSQQRCSQDFTPSRRIVFDCDQAVGQSMMQLTDAMTADAGEAERLIDAVGHLLDATVNLNDSRGRKSSLTSFEGGSVTITISQYIKRILEYGGCSPCCVFVALIFLQRLKTRLGAHVYLTSTNFQRLVLVAMMTAAKFLNDFYYSNSSWAEIGTLKLKELNKLELEFLFLMKFDLHLYRFEYDNFVASLDLEARYEDFQKSGNDNAIIIGL
eukprot:765000-Hanusia_phi.AAC.1